MNKVFLWGGKLKAKLADHMIRQAGDEVTAIFDPGLQEPAFATAALFSNDPADVKRHIAGCSHFVVCIGGERGLARTMISEFCETVLGLTPLALVHPTAYISEAAEIGKGFQAMPRAIVHHFASIGDWSIVNTNAHVDHECRIGAGVHIMGGAALAGEVKIGDYATIGTNATILPGLTIGSGSYVGAGAVVTRSVGAGEVVAGVPARTLRACRSDFDPAILDRIESA